MYFRKCLASPEFEVNSSCSRWGGFGNVGRTFGVSSPHDGHIFKGSGWRGSPSFVCKIKLHCRQWIPSSKWGLNCPLEQQFPNLERLNADPESFSPITIFATLNAVPEIPIHFWINLKNAVFKFFQTIVFLRYRTTLSLPPKSLYCLSSSLFHFFCIAILLESILFLKAYAAAAGLPFKVMVSPGPRAIACANGKQFSRRCCNKRVHRRFPDPGHDL